MIDKVRISEKLVTLHKSTERYNQKIATFRAILIAPMMEAVSIYETSVSF
jgi:hypothetical protein